MSYIAMIRNVAILYLAIGAVVCLVHPKIIRDHIATLKDLDVGIAGFLLKPAMALLVFLFACIFWPIGWLNSVRREKKEQLTFERLRAFHQIHSLMKTPVTYAGGDGSSLQQAVVLRGATLISGPRAEHDFLAQHYPGYEFRQQLLKEQDDNKYDVLEFTTTDGEIKMIYFDISAAFQRN
jgi:hypothetical protein